MTNDIAVRFCDEYLARNIADIDKEFLKKAKEALQQEPYFLKGIADACEILSNGFKNIAENFKTSADNFSRK